MARPPMRLMAVMTRPATASPRTNLLAPSMAPKNSVSRSSVSRRERACRSSTRPAARSASMAICLPGMASRTNRAATSDTRVEPLVMTVKFTTSRIMKMTMPTTRLPPTAKRPKVSMRWPAAPGPSAPRVRMSLVVATFRARRKRVTTSRRDGKTENSSARLSPREMRSIRTAMPIETARRPSRTPADTGTTRRARMPRTAKAITVSARPPPMRCSLTARPHARTSARSAGTRMPGWRPRP